MTELTDLDVQRALATFPKRFISVRVFAPFELGRGLRTKYTCDIHGTMERLYMFKTLRNAVRAPDADVIKWSKPRVWEPPPRSKRVTLLVDLACLPIVEIDPGVLEASDRANDELQVAERQVELWSLKAKVLRDRQLGLGHHAPQ